ncbi:MAG TPA: DeoR/GlpR family DNA-binding transcription regulator [Galbitalea sp.]|jgi:DeoR family transcriptional regulator of aga operon|nr:DeoR/GlpR family DNA-binding transcription regulator [Galbitalea sp.]
MAVELALPAKVRRQRIVELVEERGFVRVADLSERFRISEVTLRGDLDALADESAIRRIHGGAMSMRAATQRLPEEPFERVSLAAFAQKRAIGHTAAALVERGQAVILDVGTTTFAIATALAKRTELSDIVVITNALNIAVALEAVVPRFTVIVTGGTLRPLQHSLVDPLAGAVFEHIRADIAFIGCGGVDVVAGVTNVNIAEAELKRRMLGAAARSVVVADSGKLGISQLSRVAGLADVDELITDEDANPAEVARLRDAGLVVTMAAV